MATGEFGQGLVCALKNALCADVNPTAGRHLPVHREAAVFEIAERVPVRPGGHEERVGDEDARGPGMCTKDGDRFTRLHDERFIVLETAKRVDEGIERVPAP